MTATTQTSRDGRLAALLVEAGGTPGAARQIAALSVRDYLNGDTVTPDALADVTDEVRGIAVQYAMDLTKLARAAGRASCPDLGPALDHAARALRFTLNHGR